jgi:hypothetical protein
MWNHHFHLGTLVPRPGNQKPLDVKLQPKLSPTLLPESVAPPVQGPVQVKKSDKVTSDKGWYWRLLEWTAMDFAIYNTNKQCDGRPNVPGKSR